jgi:hypothetical protein
MLQFDTKGRITRGEYENWYILISREEDVPIEGKAENFSYYIDLGPHPDLTGGAKSGKWNIFAFDYRHLLALLEGYGIVQEEAINVEWLTTSEQ